MTISIKAYARFCAPNVLARVMETTPEEAAAYLKAGGHAAPGGGTLDWGKALEDLGAVPVDISTTRCGREAKAKYEAKSKAAWERYDRDPWGRTPRTPNYATMYPTVAAFLREHDWGTYVLTTGSHTVLAECGKVTVDTMGTGTGRGRVRLAHKIA